MTPTNSSCARNTVVAFVGVLIFSEFSVFSGAHGSSSNGDNNTDPATTSRDSLHSKGLRDVKVYCLLILLVSTFVAGISPYYLRWNESFLLLGTQFAGGVFLGTAMMHFLGDSNSTFADLTTKTYPFAFMLACVGYLFTMFSDCVIQWILSKGESPTSRVDVEEENGTKNMELPPDFVKTTNVGDTVLLIIALCFHSVFEGIAVGVSGTKSDAWRNLWTISLHKIFAAVSMGIALLKMQPNRPFFATSAYALAFALSSPVGIGIGIAIDATTQGAVADWIFSISMAIAAGVFVYVAINHLIAKGFRPTQPSNFDTPFYKFLAVLLGVAVISVVLIWD